MKLTVFFVCALVVCVTSLDIDSILENVPEEERRDFLIYHLQEGYKMVHSDDVGRTKDMKNAFSVDIYNYLNDQHKVTDEEVLKLVRDIICFDDGTCVDIGDVGIHPFTA